MNTPNKKTTSNSAVTILITTASIAAAITGWAVFANRESASATPANSVVAAGPAARAVMATPKPLPTLVPLIDATPQATTGAQAAQAGQPTVQQPLRNVNPALRPVTRSRSSR
jgi:hypothetical protein